MCGIFGYVGQNDHAATIVLEGLKSLEYRGYDSWGIAVIPEQGKKDKIVIKKKTGKIGGATVTELPASSMGFGHTRWATHGGVTDLNAHPHLDCTGKIALIHNGIIENYEPLKAKLLKKGHRFISDTDTEVAVHLIEEYAKSMLLSKAVQRAFLEMDGLNAFIVMRADEHSLVAVRNGSPLVVGFGGGENFVASDASALLPHTRQVHYLEDDQMAIVTDDDVDIYHVRTGETIHPNKQRLNWSIEQIEKGNYPFFMLKEIYEQPLILRKMLTSFDSRVNGLNRLIRQSSQVLFSGCGTAHHVAVIGKYLYAKISNKKIDTVPSSEFPYAGKFLDKKSFALFFSQSGETIDIVEAVNTMNRQKVPTGAITNRLGSSLYRTADFKILLDAGPEICVLSTKTFTAKLAILLLSSYAYAGKITQGRKELIGAIDATEKILSKQYYNRYLKKLTQMFSQHKHGYIIGRGLSYPVGMEAALKIKEVSYIHVEAFPGGELKHGVMALIEKGSPCIVFAPNDETYVDVISNAMEIKARGGYIIGVSHKTHPAFDSYCPIQDVGAATIIPQSVIGQLIGYHIAIIRKLDPDMPRNLAKSVTVK